MIAADPHPPHNDGYKRSSTYTRGFRRGDRPLMDGRWALVQVWDGAVLATYDDEVSARDAIIGADDDEVVVLHVF